MTEPRFWEQKTLDQLSSEEWESLCDGCAKCCLIKLEDEDTNEVHYTSVVCRYMDHNDCRCTEYQQRHQLVPSCVWLQVDHLEAFSWLPGSCSYRLVAEGKPLPSWHHLISGDRNAIHRAGASIRGRCLSEEYVHPDGLEEHIVRWVE